MNAIAVLASPDYEPRHLVADFLAMVDANPASRVVRTLDAATEAVVFLSGAPDAALRGARRAVAELGPERVTVFDATGRIVEVCDAAPA